MRLSAKISVTASAGRHPATRRCHTIFARCRRPSIARKNSWSYLLLWTFFGLFIFTAPPDTSAALLESIEVLQVSSSVSVISLDLSDIPISSFNTISKTKKQDARCYIDLFSTVRSELVPINMKLGDGNISKIRTGLRGSTVRVVLDLEDGVQCIRTLDQTNRRILLMASHNDVDDLALKTALLQQKKSSTDPESPLPAKKDASPEIQEEQQVSLDFQQSSFPNMFAENLQDAPSYKLWGWIKAYGASDLQEDDYDDNWYARTRGRLGLTWERALDSGNSLQTTLSGDIDHIFYDNDEADDETDISVNEAYVNLTASNWDIALGKQRIRWGKGDQISPLDMLNPEDLRQSIAVPLDEMKTPSWLLRLRYFFPKITVDTVIEPWIQTSRIDYFDSDWALYRNLRQTILSTPYISADLKEFTRNIHIHEDEPDKSPENASFAMRLSWQTDQSDYAISGRYGWETLPTITSFPVTNFSYSGQTGQQLLKDLSSANLSSDSIDCTFMRQKTFGFEWETILDQIGFRGEIAYIDRVSFLNDALTSYRKPVSYLIAGIDYTSAADWYFNIQMAWQKIHGYRSDILYFAQDNVSLLGEIRKPVWRGNLEFTTRFTTILTDHSSYLQPAVRLKYFENTEIETGLMLYSGGDDTIIGSYDNADQIYLQAKYFF